MTNFDFCLSNPPYDRKLHLDFLAKAINVADNVVSVQPANTLYTDFDKRDKFIDAYHNYGYKLRFVELNNFNKEFEIGLRVPFAISCFDKDYTGDIELETYDEKQGFVSDIDDINLIGNIDMINSIFDKVKSSGLEFCKDYYFKGYTNNYNNIKDDIGEGSAYLRNAGDIVTVNGYNSKADWVLDKYHNQEYYGFITATYVHKSKNEIVSFPEFQDNMSHPNGWIYYDKYDSYEKNAESLNNFKKFILNSNFAHYLCFTYLGPSHRDKIPLFTEEFKNDNDIYRFFGLTKDEINLVEKTCNKINHNAEWFKKYF